MMFCDVFWFIGIKVPFMPQLVPYYFVLNGVWTVILVVAVVLSVNHVVLPAVISVQVSRLAIRFGCLC
jgi:Fungal ATP synthase protein 8 (A6L)